MVVTMCAITSCSLKTNGYIGSKIPVQLLRVRRICMHRSVCICGELQLSSLHCFPSQQAVTPNVFNPCLWRVLGCGCWSNETTSTEKTKLQLWKHVLFIVSSGINYACTELKRSMPESKLDQIKTTLFNSRVEMQSSA
jgi:hypothetical protein